MGRSEHEKEGCNEEKYIFRNTKVVKSPDVRRTIFTVTNIEENYRREFVGKLRDSPERSEGSTFFTETNVEVKN
jgi:hypothetical protein